MEKSADNKMPTSTYIHILNELHENGYKGNLHLYLMGESLCDPRIHDFISVARKLFPENIIFISTNGDYLKERQDIENLLESGLTWMAISNYDQNGRLGELAEGFPNVVCTSLEKLEPSFYNRAGNIDTKCKKPCERCTSTTRGM
jgi:hypothetical protein